MNKPKTILICLATVLGIWIPYLAFFGVQPLVHDLLGIKFIPYVALAAGITSALWKNLFQMGLKDMLKTNFALKTLPIVYVLILSMGLTLIPQTFVTAFFTSIFWGVTSSYIGRVLFGK